MTVVQPRVSTEGRLLTRTCGGPCGHPHRQRQGDRGQEALRDIGHKHPDEENESGHEIQPGHQPAQEHEGKAKARGQPADHPHRDPELLLQGAPLGPNPLGGLGDLSDLRSHPGTEDHCPRMATEQGGAGKEDVGQFDPEELPGEEEGLVGLVTLGGGRLTVRGELSTSTWKASMSRASAGTRSPCSSTMMSPGTRVPASIVLSRPSRNARAAGTGALPALDRPIRSRLLQEGEKSVHQDHGQDGHSSPAFHLGHEAQERGQPEQDSEEAEQVAQQLERPGRARRTPIRTFRP